MSSSLLEIISGSAMSVDTLKTCTTVQRHGRNKAKGKRGNLKKDLTSRTGLTDVKTPEIHIEGDLGLNLLEASDIPQEMLFPGEYNVYLQDKLKSVCEENKQLSILVKDQEQEMASIKEKLWRVELQQNDEGLHRSTSHSLDTIRHADLAACRVMELTKQVCELTAQLEEQKGRCALAESNLLSLIGSQEERQAIPSEVLTKKEAEMKTLSDKLHSTHSKLFECRNKIQHLQQELKNAQKVLSCEVGEGVSIPDLISSGGNAGGWRGRAQQIQVLQQRVMELNDRLRKCCDYRTFDTAPSSCGEGKSSKERRALLEVAQQEVKMIKEQLSEYIRKLDAAKARIRVLESENSSLKAHVHTLSDKGARNDEFIQILQCQVNELEGRVQQCKDEARSEKKKFDRYFQQLQDDIKLERQRSMQLLSNLEDKEKQIKRLEDLLFDLKDQEISALKKDTKEEVVENLEVSPTKCSSVLENQVKEISKVSVSEQESKKLIDLIGTVNRRLNDARHECDKHKSALRLERQRAARFEAKLARQEMERIGSFPTLKRQIACNSKKISGDTALEVSSMSKEELLDKLELLQEEILTMKTRLSCLEQEKEDDLRVFSSILNGQSPPSLLRQRQGSYCLAADDSSKP